VLTQLDESSPAVPFNFTRGSKGPVGSTGILPNIVPENPPVKQR